MRLWEGKAPNQQGDSADDIPTLQIFRPDKAADGSAIIVFPGGAYKHLAAHESDPVARRLTQTGVTGFVLRYRRSPVHAPDAAARRRPRHPHRPRRAKEWQLDPNRIGVLGFSAGGHLAATISTKFDDGDAKAADPIDRVSSRPDVAVLCYPVITFTEVSAHTGSAEEPARRERDAEDDRAYCRPSVTSRRARRPRFCFTPMADAGVPVENSLLYAAALRREQGPVRDAHLRTGPARRGAGGERSGAANVADAAGRLAGDAPLRLGGQDRDDGAGDAAFVILRGTSGLRGWP